MITEWTEQQLRTKISLSADRQYVYLYTPLCGTCKMTDRMLNVVLELLPNVPIVKCNVNFCPQLVQSWQVRSVPCIVRFHQHRIMEKRYRMQGVEELLRWFEDTINKEAAST